MKRHRSQDVWQPGRVPSGRRRCPIKYFARPVAAVKSGKGDLPPPPALQVREIEAFLLGPPPAGEER